METVIQARRFQVIAVSEQMQQVTESVVRLGRTGASTVLLEGETGTGKRLMAQLLHASNRNVSGPLIPVNCAALPEPILESELFGEEPGALSGKASPKKGLLELASGGTLLLDEVEAMPPALQAKLLDVLEDPVVRRVGGVEDIQVDLRVIATPSIPLRAAVERKGFRGDLFQKLSVVSVEIPPLRERKEDILPLANHFAADYADKYQKKLSGIGRPAAELLLSHYWQGNVRELRSVMERAVLGETSELIQVSSIRFVAIPVPVETEPADAAVHPTLSGMSLKDSERILISRALETTAGNQTKAARLLGISRDMLRYRIRKLGLSPHGER